MSEKGKALQESLVDKLREEGWHEAAAALRFAEAELQDTKSGPELHFSYHRSQDRTRRLLVTYQPILADALTLVTDPDRGTIAVVIDGPRGTR